MQSTSALEGIEVGREEVNKWAETGLLASVLHSTDEDWLPHRRFFNPSFQNATSLLPFHSDISAPLNYHISRCSTTLWCPRANFLLCTKVMLLFSHPPLPHTPWSILQGPTTLGADRHPGGTGLSEEGKEGGGLDCDAVALVYGTENE